VLTRFAVSPAFCWKAYPCRQAAAWRCSRPRGRLRASLPAGCRVSHHDARCAARVRQRRMKPAPWSLVWTALRTWLAKWFSSRWPDPRRSSVENGASSMIELRSESFDVFAAQSSLPLVRSNRSGARLDIEL